MTKGTFWALFREANTGKFYIEKKAAWIIRDPWPDDPDHRLAVHHRVSDDKWILSDVTTGMMYREYHTKSTAVYAAKSSSNAIYNALHGKVSNSSETWYEHYQKMHDDLTYPYDKEAAKGPYADY